MNWKVDADDLPLGQILVTVDAGYVRDYLAKWSDRDALRDELLGEAERSLRFGAALYEALNALRRTDYGRHSDRCEWFTGSPCSCGAVAALEAAIRVLAEYDNAC